MTEKSQHLHLSCIIEKARQILLYAPADQLQELNVLTTKMYIKLGNKINAERWLDKVIKNDSSASSDTSE